MTKKQPNCSPEELREYFNSLGIDDSPDTIRHFINQAINGQTIDTKTAKSVAALLMEMAVAAREGADWNPYKKRIGARKAVDVRFRPHNVPIYTIEKEITPEFEIVWALYVDKRIDYGEACRQMLELHPGSKRNVERWIAAIKPRVESTAKALEMLKELSPTRNNP